MSADAAPDEKGRVEVMTLKFTIPGRPVPKARPRVGRNGCIYTPGKSRAYEQQVAVVGRLHCSRPLKGPVELRLKVYLKTPGGDLDNYIKSIQDSLNGITWHDDRQVKKLAASLMVDKYAEERAEVEIRKIQGGDNCAQGRL